MEERKASHRSQAQRFRLTVEYRGKSRFADLDLSQLEEGEAD
ncbi:MAG: hypothetical protein R6V05_06660 [Candidatus Brocadiia bacterium]